MHLGVAAVLLSLFGCNKPSVVQPKASTSVPTLADLCWLAPAEEVPINFTYDDQGLPDISVALLSQDELFFKVEGASENWPQVLIGVLIVSTTQQELEEALGRYRCGVIESLGNKTVTMRAAASHMPFEDRESLSPDMQPIVADEFVGEVKLPALWGCVRAARGGPVSKVAEFQFTDWFVAGENLIHDSTDSAIILTKDIPTRAIEALRDGSASLIIWPAGHGPYMRLLGCPRLNTQ
jgi:hypothetical protein